LFWQRQLVWREGACYRNSDYDPLHGMAAVSPCEPTNMDDPLVRQAIRQTPSLQSFLRWSILPQAVVQRSRCSIKVTISDARYGDRRNSRLGRDVILPTGAPNC